MKKVTFFPNFFWQKVHFKTLSFVLINISNPITICLILQLFIFPKKNQYFSDFFKNCDGYT